MNRLLSSFFSVRSLCRLALVLAWPVLLHAGNFDDANRAFAEGHYAESAQDYENLLHQHGWSAAVLFNLANADVRQGKTADAILSYERALWLAPEDPDILANLNLTRKQLGLGIPETSWYEHAADTFSPNAWAWISSGLFTLLCAALFAAQGLPQKRRLLRVAAVGAALALFISGAALTIQSQNLQRAVVMSGSASALISPFTNAKMAFPVAAGELVHVEKAYGDFWLVKSSDGRSGWMPKEQVEKVIPVS